MTSYTRASCAVSFDPDHVDVSGITIMYRSSQIGYTYLWLWSQCYVSLVLLARLLAIRYIDKGAIRSAVCLFLYYCRISDVSQAAQKSVGVRMDWTCWLGSGWTLWCVCTIGGQCVFGVLWLACLCAATSKSFCIYSILHEPTQTCYANIAFCQAMVLLTHIPIVR